MQGFILGGFTWDLTCNKHVGLATPALPELAPGAAAFLFPFSGLVFAFELLLLYWRTQLLVTHRGEGMVCSVCRGQASVLEASARGQVAPGPQVLLLR